MLISAGDTKVICTASVEDRVPPFLRNTGKGWVTAEYGMLPRATSTRMQREATQGKVGGRTQEIQRLIGRSLRAVTNLQALGERTIWIDCDVIQADGGTRTASITGAFVALALALEKLRERDAIRTIPLTDYVAAISVGIVDGEPLLDLAYDGGRSADVDMNIVKTGDGRFIEVQGTAEAIPFGRDALLTAARPRRSSASSSWSRSSARSSATWSRNLSGLATGCRRMMRLFRTTLPTPLGRHAGARVGRGAVRARVHDRQGHARVVRSGCRGWMRGWRGGFRRTRSSSARRRSSRETRRWLRTYFAGTAAEIDGLPLDMRGAPFEQRVWRALPAIPPARPPATARSRKALGSAGASRAVGAANGANPIAIIVPCHRVIGSSGTLTGYGGGLDRKTWLIEHERRWRTEPQASLF